MRTFGHFLPPDQAQLVAAMYVSESWYAGIPAMQMTGRRKKAFELLCRTRGIVLYDRILNGEIVSTDCGKSAGILDQSEANHGV